MTTAATTIATPPQNPPRLDSPQSTDKLSAPASRKRTLLQALETEVAYIEMLLKAKGDLAAKKAWDAAWQHSGAGCLHASFSILSVSGLV